MSSRAPQAQQFDDSLAKVLEPVRTSYKATKTALMKLPEGRMRSLAITDLESSFARACFAASEMFDPIGDS